MADRILKRHDTHVVPRVLLLDENGTPINLTGCTVRYSLMLVQSRVLKVSRGTATTENQATKPGEVYYTLTGANVDTAGIYSEEWEVTYGDLTIETFPVGIEQIVRIVADLDNT